MKTLSNVAVFGLLPMPSIAAAWNGGGAWTAAEEISDALRRACLLQGIGERMATRDELACIRRELEHVAAATSKRQCPFARMTGRIRLRAGEGVVDRHREQLS